MQVDQTAAQIYARAVFNLAKGRGILNEFSDDVNSLGDFLASEHGGRLQRFLESPAVLTEDKTVLVDKAFGKQLGVLPRNLIHMLIKRLRIENLPLILAELRRLINEERGLKPGRVTTAVELDNKQREALLKALEKRAGTSLALEYEVRPHILGGVIFKYEDKLFDDSLRTRLEELRLKLMRSPVAQAAG